jgi:hypothetical protein
MIRLIHGAALYVSGALMLLGIGILKALVYFFYAIWSGLCWFAVKCGKLKGPGG